MTNREAPCRLTTFEAVFSELRKEVQCGSSQSLASKLLKACEKEGILRHNNRRDSK